MSVFLERPDGGDLALLVHAGARDEADRAELAELARSAGATLCGEISTTRPHPDPRYYIGAGKVDELKALVASTDAEVVICGVELSPSQERNLEQVLECRVMDRTRLILDIFAQRASSYEGKLQVELAQLEHLSTRLVRGWTHLERQKGGIGLRGPGETQLETDRRLVGARIRQIRDRLDGVRSRRKLSRRARKRAALPVVSLVGYTNAGKSTLFNRLTGASVIVRDLLFATLDPTLRRLPLPGGAKAVAADTVGFVRRLPHDLVAAFEATLEESREAALLLHVVDAGDPERDDKMAEVEDVLSRIGAAGVPCLVVHNKIDTREGAEPRVFRDEAGLPTRVDVSALTGDGMDLLSEAIAERLQGVVQTHVLRIPWQAAAVRAALFEAVEVAEESVDDERGWTLTVRATTERLERILARAVEAGSGLVTVEGLGQGSDQGTDTGGDETGSAAPEPPGGAVHAERAE